MKKTILFAAFFLAALVGRAQQEQHYTQFMYNKLLTNPGYAGMREVPSLTAIYRNQWAGFEGAPQSALLSLNTPFINKRVGIGLTLSHLKIGLQRDLQTNFAYSYALMSNDDVVLRIGLVGNLRFLGLDFQEADPYTVIDASIDNKRVNEVMANAGIGAYASFGENFYGGISVPRLIQNPIGLNTDPGVTAAHEVRHFYGMGGAVIPINEDTRLLTAVLFKYVKNAPFDADLNLNLEINWFTMGLSYRMGGDGPGDSVDLLAFFQLGQRLGLGVSYDFTLSRLNDYSVGSFEVVLMTDLKEKAPRRMTNPRFFM